MVYIHQWTNIGIYKELFPKKISRKMGNVFEQAIMEEIINIIQKHTQRCSNLLVRQIQTEITVRQTRQLGIGWDGCGFRKYFRQKSEVQQYSCSKEQSQYFVKSSIHITYHQATLILCLDPPKNTSHTSLVDVKGWSLFFMLENYKQSECPLLGKHLGTQSRRTAVAQLQAVSQIY